MEERAGQTEHQHRLGGCLGAWPAPQPPGDSAQTPLTQRAFPAQRKSHLLMTFGVKTFKRSANNPNYKDKFESWTWRKDLWLPDGRGREREESGAWAYQTQLRITDLQGDPAE